MAEIITADQLDVGDVFRRHGPRYTHDIGDLAQVTGRRTVRFAETYTVLDTVSVDGFDRRGQVDLRYDISVQRVRSLAHDEALVAVAAMSPGQSLSLWRRPDGGYFG